MARRRPVLPSLAAAICLLVAVLSPCAVRPFTTPSSIPTRAGRTVAHQPQTNHNRHHDALQRRTGNRQARQSTTSLNFMGSDGGILGVGAPEVAVTLLVGYFVLGPSDLYKLVKEIGKFVQNFRTLGTEAAKSFEGTMENQLEIEGLRKAQAELNDAFSFRRSINTDDTEAFSDSNFVDNTVESAAAATAVAEGPTGARKKKRMVRRKKKRPEDEVPPEVPAADVAKEYPDLDMLDDSSADGSNSGGEASDAEKRRAERLERLTANEGESKPGEPDWFKASEEDIASEVLGQQQTADPAMAAYEKQRFQSQLTVEDWNAQVMANEDKLSPIATVMQRLALLEEEKNAADRRIEEEYRKRMDNEDKYYLEKRRALEEAVTEIQEGAFEGVNGSEDKENLNANV
mmetsp:Transcript_16197/g.37415  ORF Transcript_16197/g.37415 Transcript_16197/m.37415 type:complete len:402 (+) Transcript_16197:50-1255(+)